MKIKSRLRSFILLTLLTCLLPCKVYGLEEEARIAYNPPLEKGVGEI
jgi:hypothetical protein